MVDITGRNRVRYISADQHCIQLYTVHVAVQLSIALHMLHVHCSVNILSHDLYYLHINYHIFRVTTSYFFFSLLNVNIYSLSEQQFKSEVL